MKIICEHKDSLGRNTTNRSGKCSVCAGSGILIINFYKCDDCEEVETWYAGTRPAHCECGGHMSLIGEEEK